MMARVIDCFSTYRYEKRWDFAAEKCAKSEIESESDWLIGWRDSALYTLRRRRSKM